MRNIDIKLDPWQEDVLSHDGNLCLCTGRQVGKSTVISMRAGEFAINNPNKRILVIAAVERQALLLFEKILAYIHDNHKHFIKTGKDKPTKHELKLKNGSIIYCLPTGQTGYGIRGYTIDDLYADEAHFIPEEVWSAVTPMLATTGGRINLLSTPDLTKGKDGYFYRCSLDPDFKFLNISSIEVAEKREEPQRSSMLDHFEKEKGRLSKAQYAAEYLGQFVDAQLQFFSNEWIDKVCVLNETSEIKHNAALGVDIAGMGEDETTYEAITRKHDVAHQVYHQVTTQTRTTETIKRIVNLDKSWNFDKIGVDDGGMGVGVFDHLLIEDQTRHKVVGLNNASRSIDKDDRRKKLLKEDMYMNMLAMGERGELKLFDRDDIKASLRSIAVDPEAPGFKLAGQKDHIAEGLIRACWLKKEKDINISIYTIKV